MIHILFHYMSRLLRNILKHFVNNKSLFDAKNGVLNLDKEEHLKSTKLIEVGTNARNLIQNCVFVGKEPLKFY